METIAHWFHYIAEILYYINPMMMIFACCMWIKIFFSTGRRLDDAMMRAYVLERQVDLLIQNSRHGTPISKMDMDHIDMLRGLRSE